MTTLGSRNGESFQIKCLQCWPHKFLTTLACELRTQDILPGVRMSVGFFSVGSQGAIEWKRALEKKIKISPLLYLREWPKKIRIYKRHRIEWETYLNFKPKSGKIASPPINEPPQQVAQSMSLQSLCSRQPSFHKATLFRKTPPS